MAKSRPSKPAPRPSIVHKAPRSRRQAGIVHTSLYLPKAVHEALREVAFKERCKIHDVVLEGIGLALRKRGMA